MRQWVNEKKKTLIEKIRKVAETNYMNEKQKNIKNSKLLKKVEENELT